MKTKWLLMLVVVAMAALAIGQVQASTVNVPNGNFEQIYKPGSTTITVTNLGGWVDGVGPSTPLNSGVATFSDGSTGPSVDVPGWIGAPGWLGDNKWEGIEENWNRQTAINSNTGDESAYAIGANGGNWAHPNGEIAVSAEPLGNVNGGTYTFSVRMRTVDSGNPPLPVVWDLLADGSVLTPTSSVAPAMTTEFQSFSKTYDATSLSGHFGKSLTIQLGVGSPATGTQMKFDNVTLEVDGQMNPSPADGATVPVGDVDLSWTNLDPNIPGDPVYVDVWFGTEPNELHPGYDMIKVVAANIGDPNRTTWTVNAPTAGTYYWRVDSYVNGNPTGDPIKGIVWSFIAVEDLAPTIVIDTANMMTWSGEPVPLNATVTDDGQSALTWLWTADPADGVVFDDDTAEDTNVTITKATDNPSTVTLTVAVHDAGNPTPDTDTMEIDVYEDACQLARIGLGLSDITDFDENCITDLKDFAVIAAAWLDDYSLTGPFDKQ